MDLPARRLNWTKAIALGGIAFAGFVGVVLADGFDPDRLIIDTDRLVRFAQSDVEVADWVSTTPLQNWVVKKIEAGRVSYVSVVRTPTGTYSSDGLASPHIRYPGIASANLLNNITFSAWNQGRWTQISAYSGNSYVSVSTARNRHGDMRTHTCIASASFIYC